MRSASWFITGNAPGNPRQTGQVCVFGSAPNSTGHAQNIFERVFSWTCTSRPTAATYSITRGFTSIDGQADRLLSQRVIAKNKCSHRFNDRHGPWQYARIMTAARRELGSQLRAGHGSLLPRDRRGRFKRDTKINVFAVADAALHTAGIICRRTDFTAASFKRASSASLSPGPPPACQRPAPRARAECRE